MAILEFQESVNEASPRETTKATSLEKEIKLGHPIRRPGLYVALAAPSKQRTGRPSAADQEDNRLIVATSSISNQLSSPVLHSSVSPDKFPVAGEGFPCPYAPTILRGDRRKVLVLQIRFSDMRPLRCRNGVPGSEREGFVRIVAQSEVILGPDRYVAGRPSPDKFSSRHVGANSSNPISRELGISAKRNCDWAILIATVEVRGSSRHGPTIFYSELASTTPLGKATNGSIKEAVRSY
jgi:hypothetical protein